MQKVTGIKSVDFKIHAYGHGVVNWNGSIELKTLIDGSWKTVTNHNMPKLRGYINKKLASNDKGEKFETLKEATEINFDETPLYISQNCIRYHLFKDDVINWQHPKIHENVDMILCSMTGLLRGYVIPKNENKRTSPLLLTDFLELGKKGNFEQLGRAGSKEKQETKSGKDKSNSLFSKTTFGDTKYVAYGSINIEQLQFIALSNDFGQEAIRITTDKEGIALAKKIENYIKTLDFAHGDIKATYHSSFVRKGTIFAEGQKGILLNEDAIDTLVKQMLNMIENLGFSQAKGYMYVEDVRVDYNNFAQPKDMFRIRKNSSEISPQKSEAYAIYYQQGE
ncbi:type I-Fv CRISPR-associated protein Cas7fv [Moraxella catarrhalis]|uniref:type I-Fv CRISPR-associated protein Cas7fv n=1 Tax=Moraxella catarrhalis TaxID=480 RepID=UPI0013CFD712|nr:type I-Fv CRISPR-associated protein Cas7fv [Moraxella catarrhalis]